MSSHRIYRYTSIARPLDPAWPTNRAVMYLLPAALLAGIVFSLLSGTAPGKALLAGLQLAAALFGTWALGRELLPDDHAAAFVAMAMGLLACLAEPDYGLLTLFTTLGLVRIVNRSTGLPARVPDSFLVTVLTALTLYLTQNPWLGAVGAVAFALDGILAKPLRRQWLFALFCLGAMIEYVVDYDARLLNVSPPERLGEWLTVLALVIFSLHLLLLRKVHSRGDADPQRLDLTRVKGGMAIGVLATLQGLGRMPEVILPAAVIGGLCLGVAFRRAFRAPATGLRGPE